MSDLLSVLIVNGGEDTASQFEALPDVQLASAELSPDAWNEALRQQTLDILVVELNTRSDFTATLNRIEKTRVEFPDLSIFVTSTNKSPELIIAAMRSGVQEFLTKPINQHEFNQAVERSRKRKHASGGRGHTGTLISVFSKTGGVGVTTLAVNLGVALAQSASKRAALVDLNLQHGDAASLLNLEPKYSIVDACESGDQVDDDKLQSCMAPHPSGLFILSEPPHPAASEEVSAQQIQSVLQKLMTVYPYVVVDLPHNFDPRVMVALDLSSLILLTTVATIPALRASRKVLSLFHEMGYSPDKVKLVVNRVSKVDRIEAKEVARTLDYEAFWNLPNNYMATSDALNTGTPLVAQKRPSNVAKSIMEMAEIVSRLGSHSRPSTSKER
ncbi:MAG: AAA family ATPase [Candidatus Zixiibacteriota bacterium]